MIIDLLNNLMVMVMVMVELPMAVKRKVPRNRETTIKGVAISASIDTTLALTPYDRAARS